MKKYAGIVLITIFIIITILAFSKIPFGNYLPEDSVPSKYLKGSKNDTGSQNVVTAVVVSYRGFDTLGEVTVLFVSSAAVGSLSSLYRRKISDILKASEILQTGTRLLFGFIALFGIYIFTHGHLTPGGGFPGGAVIASAYLLGYVALGDFHVSKRAIKVSEGLAGITFVFIGTLSIFLTGYFLYNFLPHGLSGYLVSGGVIPLIYSVIGVKVGVELTGIVSSLKEGGR